MYFKMWTVTGFKPGALCDGCRAVIVVGEAETDCDLTSKESAIEAVRGMLRQRGIAADAPLRAIRAA